MSRAKKHWRKVPSPVRKSVVLVLGFGIVGIGIVLLPLPGPGWLIIFLGLAILATEFEFAERIRAWIVGQLQVYLEKIKQTIRKSRSRK